MPPASAGSDEWSALNQKGISDLSWPARTAVFEMDGSQSGGRNPEVLLLTMVTVVPITHQHFFEYSRVATGVNCLASSDFAC